MVGALPLVCSSGMDERPLDDGHEPILTSRQIRRGHPMKTFTTLVMGLGLAGAALAEPVHELSSHGEMLNLQDTSAPAVSMKWSFQFGETTPDEARSVTFGFGPSYNGDLDRQVDVLRFGLTDEGLRLSPASAPHNADQLDWWGFDTPGNAALTIGVYGLVAWGIYEAVDDDDDDDGPAEDNTGGSF